MNSTKMTFVFVMVWAFVAMSLGSASAETLPGRFITYKKTFDGWWDVACDTAPDGTDPRCYVQYVDPYSFPPKFRAAMVDFLYRKNSSGKSIPIITFDIEPDLSWSKHAKLLIERPDNSREVMDVGQCRTSKCVYAGDKAGKILEDWSAGKALILQIVEHDGKTIERRWPLGNMREMVRIMAEQRKLRNLP